MHDAADITLTQAEHDKIGQALVGIAGFDSNACFHQLTNGWAFIPETISGSDGSPGAVLALVKYLLAH